MIIIIIIINIKYLFWVLLHAHVCTCQKNLLHSNFVKFELLLLFSWRFLYVHNVIHAFQISFMDMECASMFVYSNCWWGQTLSQAYTRKHVRSVSSKTLFSVTCMLLSRVPIPDWSTWMITWTWTRLLHASTESTISTALPAQAY